MFIRSELKANAKSNFKRNYWTSVGVCTLPIGISIAIYIFMCVAGVMVGSLTGETGIGYAIGTAILQMIRLVIVYFVYEIIALGVCSFFIKNRTMSGEVSNILDGFKSGNYMNLVKVLFLKDIFISLWSLLFIIPGIVKAYEYRMIPYILAENPGMNRKEVFEISKRMMQGKKWETFVLDFSFIGWSLLGSITCGIAFIFYVLPYINATYAELYAFNKQQAYAEGCICK